jgi:hypothetical protein
LANTETWEKELKLRTGAYVQLEFIQGFPFGGIEIDASSLLIADLFWRDPTLNHPHEIL